MPSPEISEVQSDILREQIVPEFLALLEDAPTLSGTLASRPGAPTRKR